MRKSRFSEEQIIAILKEHHYNTERPHTSLDGLSPCTFANRSIMGSWATIPTDSGHDRGQHGGRVRIAR
jgi:hypothetical protein